jgi:hypothetical protein
MDLIQQAMNDNDAVSSWNHVKQLYNILPLVCKEDCNKQLDSLLFKVDMPMTPAVILERTATLYVAIRESFISRGFANHPVKKHTGIIT